MAQMGKDSGWQQIVLISGKIKGHPHFYNCKFNDNTKGSIQLLPGENWSLQDTVDIQDENLGQHIGEKDNSCVSPTAHRTFRSVNLEIPENGIIESNRVYRIPELQHLQSSPSLVVTPTRVFRR